MALRASFARKLLAQADHLPTTAGSDHRDPRLRLASSPPAGAPPTAANPHPRVGIIGAGMAGLYAALLLADLGLEFEVLEANPTRLGGRIYTHYFNTAPDQPEGSHPASGKDKPEFYDYFDVGAMRYPRLPTMDRVVGNQPWSLVNVINARLPAEEHVETVPYIMSHPNNVLMYNGIKRFGNEPTNKDAFEFSKTGVPMPYAEEDYSVWLNLAYEPYIDLMKKDFNKGFQELLKADKHSTRSYLRSFDRCDLLRKFELPERHDWLQHRHNHKGKRLDRKYPEAVISWCETMDSGTGLYDMAFTESIMDSFDFSGSDPWLCIKGGSIRLYDGLKKAAGVEVGKNLFTGKRVIAIQPNKTLGTLSGIQVRVRGEDSLREYDHVISTVPFSILRLIDTSSCEFSGAKRTALRALRYDSSVKVALHFKSRWWQDPAKMDQGKAFYGGKSGTDSPLRTVVYPSYPAESSQVAAEAPAMIIVSYTWSQDAARIGSMTAPHGEQQQVLVQLCLRELERLHGPIVHQEYDGKYFCYDWARDPYAQGAFALYGPGQFTGLYPGVIEPAVDERLHFAGEAASIHHAWVIGSLNSAYRSVWEILQREGLETLQQQLIERWGTIDEVEYGKFPAGVLERLEEDTSGRLRKLLAAGTGKEGFEQVIGVSAKHA